MCEADGDEVSVPNAQSIASKKLHDVPHGGSRREQQQKVAEKCANIGVNVLQRQYRLAQRHVDEFDQHLLRHGYFGAACRIDDISGDEVPPASSLFVGSIHQYIGIESNHRSCISSRVTLRPPKSRPLSKSAISRLCALRRSFSVEGRRSTGSSRATGLPLRVMVIVLPLSASLRILEKLRLASLAPTEDIGYLHRPSMSLR